MRDLEYKLIIEVPDDYSGPLPEICNMRDAVENVVDDELIEYCDNYNVVILDSGV